MFCWLIQTHNLQKGLQKEFEVSYKTDAEISGVFILFILIIWLEGKSLSPEIGDANGE